MFRKKLIDLLLDRPLSVREIARLADESPKTIADDLEHLFRSLKHLEYVAVRFPAECRKCGFEFDAAKLRRPSKCPECRSTWISEPAVMIQKKAAAPQA